MKRQDENKVEYTIECRFCGMQFTSGASFQIHLRMHNSPSSSILEESSRQLNIGEELPFETHSQSVSNVTDEHVPNSSTPSGNEWVSVIQRDENTDSLSQQEIVPYQRHNFHPSPFRPWEMSRFDYQRSFEPRSAWPTNNQVYVYGVRPPETTESHRLQSLHANWLRVMRSPLGHSLAGQPTFHDNESGGNSNSDPNYESQGVPYQETPPFENEPQDACPSDNQPLYSSNNEAPLETPETPISYSQLENELQRYEVCPYCQLLVINPTIYDNESGETLASPSDSNPIYGSQGIIYQGTPILQCQCANQPRGMINPSCRYPSPQFMQTRPINHGNELQRTMHFRPVNPLVYRSNYVPPPERRYYSHFENEAQGVIRGTTKIRFAHAPQSAGFYRAPFGTEAITPDCYPIDVTSPDYDNSHDHFPINESSLGATSENYSTLLALEGPELYTSPEDEPEEIHTVSGISPLIASNSFNNANESYDHSSENLPSTSARQVQCHFVHRENISPLYQTRPLSHGNNEPREHLMPGHIPDNVYNRDMTIHTPQLYDNTESGHTSNEQSAFHSIPNIYRTYQWAEVNDREGPSVNNLPSDNTQLIYDSVTRTGICENGPALWQQYINNCNRLIETGGVVNTNSQNESMMSISSLHSNQHDTVDGYSVSHASPLDTIWENDSSLQNAFQNRRTAISYEERDNLSMLPNEQKSDHFHRVFNSSASSLNSTSESAYTAEQQNDSNRRRRISATYESSGFHESDNPIRNEGQGAASILTDQFHRVFSSSASSLNSSSESTYTAEQQNDSNRRRRRVSATHESSGFHRFNYPISNEGQSIASMSTNRQEILLRAIIGSASSLNSTSQSAYTAEQQDDSNNIRRKSASHDSTGFHRSHDPNSNEGQDTASMLNYRQALFQGISGSASSLNVTNDSNSIRRISREHGSAGSLLENERRDTMNMLKSSQPSPKHSYGHSNSSGLIREGFQQNAHSETNFTAQQQNNNSRRGISSSHDSTRFHIGSERQVITTKPPDNRLLVPHSTVSINLTGRRLRDTYKHPSVVNSRQIACPIQGAAEFCSENEAQVQTSPESPEIVENSFNNVDPVGEGYKKKDKLQLYSNCGSDSTLQQRNDLHTTKRRIFTKERNALGNGMPETNPSRRNEEKGATAVTPDELFSAGPPSITGLINGRHIRNWPPFEEPHIITPTPRRGRCRIHNGEIRDPRAMSPRRPLYRNIPNLRCIVRGQSNFNHVPTDLPTLTEADEDQFTILQQSNSYNYRQNLATIQERNRFNEVRHAIQLRYNVSGIYTTVSLSLGRALNDANITNRSQTASNSSSIPQQRNRVINRTSTSVRFRIQVVHFQSPNAHVPYMVIFVFGNQQYVCI